MQSMIAFLLSGLVLPALLTGGDAVVNPHRLWTNEQEQIGCTTCHHPHRPMGNAAHWYPAMEATRRFELYESREGIPGPTSLLCLGCHDGAIASEVPVESGAHIVSQIGQSASITDNGINFPLGNHPMGIRYDPHGEKLVPLANVEADRQVALPEGRVECISCHDPHGTAGHEHLLVKANRRSALCLTCHQL